ncbi:MAG: hypothetical protein ACYCV7_16575, partial [Acidimicrobiales bacterium]
SSHGPAASARPEASRRSRLAVAAGIVAIGGAAIGGAALTANGLTSSAHQQSALPAGHPSGHPRGIYPIGPFAVTGAGGAGGAGGSNETAANLAGIAPSSSGSGTSPAQSSISVVHSGPTTDAGTGASLRSVTPSSQPGGIARSTPPPPTSPTPPGSTNPPPPTSGLNGVVSGLAGTVDSTVFGVLGLLGQTLGV